jgi:hypothetical protein
MIPRADKEHNRRCELASVERALLATAIVAAISVADSAANVELASRSLVQLAAGELADAEEALHVDSQLGAQLAARDERVGCRVWGSRAG